MRVGVVADSLAMPAKEALARVAELGFRTVQIDATAGDLDPANLSRTGRRHLLRYTADLGLSLEALGAAGDQGRLIDPGAMDQRLEKLAQIMALAREVRVPAVTVRLGTLVDVGDKRQRDRAIEALRFLAEQADRTDVTVAVETAGIAPEALSGLLREIDSPQVRACYDPAEIAMSGGDPIAQMEALGGRIAVAHVRDAVPGRGGRPGHETPIGRGGIDWRAYLASLDQAGFGGTPLIKRLGAARPAEELEHARRLIESIAR